MISDLTEYQMRCELSSVVQEVFQFKTFLVYLLTIKKFNIDIIANNW